MRDGRRSFLACGAPGGSVAVVLTHDGEAHGPLGAHHTHDGGQFDAEDTPVVEADGGESLILR